MTDEELREQIKPVIQWEQWAKETQARLEILEELVEALVFSAYETRYRLMKARKSVKRSSKG